MFPVRSTVFLRLPGVARLVSVAVVAVLLSACGSKTFGSRESPAERYAELMGQADGLRASGAYDAALRTYGEAARADSTRKEPWARSAQLYFDSGNYGRAIAAAEEVLQRDASDVSADSILTIGGFRIAVVSLRRLQETGALSSEAARAEAEKLAEALRSTLGDAILAPPPTAPARQTRRNRTQSPASQARPAAERSTAAPAPAAKPAEGSDPFRHLRQGGN